MIADSAWDMPEQIRGKEKCVEDAAAAVEAYEGKLIGKADGEGDMVR